MPPRGLIEEEWQEPFALAPDPAAGAEYHELQIAIRKVLKTIPGTRFSAVVMWRWGLMDGKARTLDETGQLFKVSGSRVRQMEDKVFRLLQTEPRCTWLRGFIDEGIMPQCDTMEREDHVNDARD